jgi:glycosyltransferase involved in cell wall biosynthesis
VRILHVISSLNPADGGPPEVVCQIARSSAQVGVEVEVASLDCPGAEYLHEIGFPVHALGPGALGRFGLSSRLQHWLRQNARRFDALVAHGIWTWPGVAVRRAALSAGRPYGIFPHGALDPWFKRQYPLKHLKKKLFWPIQYPVLRDARPVFFTCESERDLATTSFHPSRWTSQVIQLGAGEPAGEANTQIEVWLQRFPQLRDRRYLLFLGRLHEKKGCDLLLRAFAAVAAAAADLDLVMAGPDQVGWQGTLQQLSQTMGVAARVHWPGMLTGDAKWGALRAAEAFVLPSHQENFGIAVAESLAGGRPVLISDKVNIWQEIDAERVGLVDSDTQEGTERLLRRWLELPVSEREAMATRCHPCFLRRYSMERTAQALRDAFRERP